MDPISLASSIITFIDFATKLFAAGHSLYRSTDGLSAQNADLTHSLDRLDALYADLSKPPALISAAEQDRSGTGSSAGEVELCRLAAECAGTATQLRAALEKIAVKPGSVRSAVVGTVRSVFDGEVKRCEGRMERINADFQRYMSAVLLDRQSSMSKFLVKLADEHRHFGLEGQRQVNNLRDDLVDLMEKSRDDVGGRLQEVQDVCESMKQLLLSGQEMAAQHRLLKSLHFAGMRERRNNIFDTHEDTYEWIFDSSHADLDLGFAEWLRTGSGVYWITGNPGAGKSTMMKHIYQHERSITLLEEWARPNRLITGSFFFWSSGSKMGKSLEGLLRSMTFEILQQCPELVSCISENHEQDFHWTEHSSHYLGTNWSKSKLVLVLRAFALQTDAKRRFCIFIDGMDEFEGGDLEVSKVLSEIVSWGTFKLCLSSRPHVTFKAVFGNDSRLVLELHQHSRLDIRKYAADLLNIDTCNTKARLQPGIEALDGVRGPKTMFSFTRDEARLLLDLITSMADGVFLWVYLVINKIQESIYNCDTLEEIRAILDNVPQGLDAYLNTMLDSIPQSYWSDSSKIFLICMHDGFGEMPLLAFQSIAPLPNESLTLDNLEAWKERAAKRLTARSAGFLSTTRSYSTDGSEIEICVQFAHRTMSDFLCEQKSLDKIISRVDPAFDICYTICSSLTNRLPEIFLTGGAVGDPTHKIWHAIDSARKRTGDIPVWIFDEANAKLASAAAQFPDLVTDLRVEILSFAWNSDFIYLNHAWRRDSEYVNALLLDVGFPQRPLEIALRDDLTHWPTKSTVDWLLEHGADPNKSTGVDRGTVWTLFLESMVENNGNRIRKHHPNLFCGLSRGSSYPLLLMESMIHANADLHCTVPYVLNGREHAYSLTEFVDAVLPREDAIRVKRVITEENHRRAQVAIMQRAQWSGWS
ncbi:hypothetical protein FH972_021752 [Carpinus fangiana]|uniref:NACHT domain-containing protein n=1 Tax=Carpinus fangiana TaxID=176857 RepID=A0A5N6KQL3_9ROSI|nr:hypothetical protein FH972_021752 [Carpinus fangiana]